MVPSSLDKKSKIKAADMASTHGSRAASGSSRRSERLQEMKEASEELRRVTRQRARVSAAKKKLEAAEEAEKKKMEAQQAEAAAARQEKHADLEAEMEILEADGQHARRMLEAVSDGFSSTDGGSAWEEGRNLPTVEDAAKRTSQWANNHAPAAQAELQMAEQEEEARGRELGEKTAGAAAGAAARAAAAADASSCEALGRELPDKTARAAAPAAAQGAAGDAGRNETALATASAAVAAAARAERNAEAVSSGRDHSTEEASEKLINQVSRIFSIAAINKPHYNRELPIFTGDPLQFIAFKSIFTQSTDLMKLDDSQNLLRLQTALKGRARECVSGLLMSPSNVKDIMKSLELLFGNPNQIILHTVADVRRMKELKESLDPLELLRFACQVKNLVATVRSVNKTEHLFNPELLETLVSKLPKNLATLWLGDKNRAINNSEQPVLVYFSEWLEELAVRAQDAGFSTGEPARRFQDATRDKKFRNGQKRNFVLNTHGQQASKCLHCEGMHYLSKCGKLKDLPLDERWGTVRKLGVCFKCLGMGHSRNKCPANKKYPKNRFHFLLTAAAAPRTTGQQEAEGAARVERESDSTTGSDVVITNTVSPNKVFLQVVPVIIKGPRGFKRVHALLDSGSTVTLLEQSIARQLGIRGRAQPLEVAGVSGMKVSNLGAEIVSFGVKGSMSSKVYDIRAYSVKDLNLPALKCFEGNASRGAIEESYYASKMENVTPQLLIGADHGDLIVTKGAKRINEHMSLAQTRLGWVPIGTGSPKSDTGPTYSFCTGELSGDESLQKLLEQNLRLEQDWPGRKREPVDVLRATELLQATTSIANGIWSAGLLWREDERIVPDSKPLALARLKSIERRMDADPDYAKAYCLKMNHYVKQGYAEEVQLESLAGRKNIWFIPHLGVVHPAKPGKLRVVHDAAACVKGVSLNSQLLPGPDLSNSIVGVLCRFREYAVGFMADIADMFLRIRIQEKDQYSQLFLWRGDRRDIEPRIFKMNSLIFGAKTSPCTAEFVRIKNAERFRERFPRAVTGIIENFYVDDLLFGADTVVEARKLINDIIWINSQGNFNLVGWSSNEGEALSDVRQEERTTRAVALEKGDLCAQRLLGLEWLPNTDELGFNLRMDKLDEGLKTGKKVPTKREALRVVMSVYDPLGILSPVSIRAKVLMQSLWSRGIGWDQVVPPDLFESWRDWLKVLDATRGVKLPRYLGTTRNTEERREMHIFCDASSSAMCAVAYLRVEKENKSVSVSFLASKTRVGPLKGQTVPRMELTAALLGAQLANKIITEQTVEIHEKVLWTDSTNVIWWLRSSSVEHQQFVSNRLGALDELTSPKEWRWLSGKSNPADDGTRVTSVIDLSPGGRWLSGPEFLSEPRRKWPTEIPRTPNESEKSLLEFRPAAVFTLQAKVVSILDTERFSQHRRMIRTMGYVLKFAQLCRRETAEVALSARDVARAEISLVKESQRRSFSREIDLVKGQKVVPKDSRLWNVNLHVDEQGILRISGRIENADFAPRDTRNPMVLDGRDQYTRLLIIRTHEESAHGGVELVLATLRERFWIVCPRNSIKKLIYQCVRCTMRKSKPMTALMGQLPIERLQMHERCFSVVGVDFFGPVMVTIRRAVEKRYGVMFTCMGSRASHLELAGDLSTNATMQAVRRFIARRGKPRIFWSDRGTNLVSASAELRKAVAEISNEEIRERLTNEQIEWKLNPPGAPNFGGSWESLIKLTKRALYAVLKERAPTEETLRTLLAEVEAILNRRPLAHITLDSRDDIVLTPNHLLLGHSGGSSAMGEYTTQDLNSRKQWIRTQALADSFWHKWRRDILPTMVQRPKWKVSQPPIGVGDLVILLDPSHERGRWTRARVEKTYPDKKGCIRVVDVKAGGKIYRRTIGKLVKLQVASKP